MLDTKLNNNKAVIYARYSSENQTEQSIEGQVRVIKEYAVRNNIPIIDCYVDRALSGTNDRRPEFQKLIADSKRKEFGYVLVYKYDRFSRDRLNSLLYKRELRKNGVKVVSVTEYISDDPQGILFESIIDGYSEYYSAELSQKVKRGNRESRIKGLFTGGNVLYGYYVIDKKYHIDEKEGPIVKRIFEMAAEGYTYQYICEQLNEEGITRRGTKFSHSSIANMLHNKRYYGYIEVNEEVYTNIIPPIITEELFKQVHKVSVYNKKRGAHYKARVEYLLSGKIFCGYCGRIITSDSGTGKARKTNYYYYKCSTRKRYSKPCELKTYKKDELEDIVISKINYLILNKNIIDKLAEYITKAYNSSVIENSELVDNQRQISRNKKEIDNIVTVISQGIFNDSLKEKLENLEKEKAELQKIHDKLTLRTKNKITKEDALVFLNSLIDEDNNTQAYKRKILSRFVDKVYVYNDKLEIHLIAMQDKDELDSNNNKETLIETDENNNEFFLRNGSVIFKCKI